MDLRNATERVSRAGFCGLRNLGGNRQRRTVRPVYHAQVIIAVDAGAGGSGRRDGGHGTGLPTGSRLGKGTPIPALDRVCDRAGIVHPGSHQSIQHTESNCLYLKLANHLYPGRPGVALFCRHAALPLDCCQVASGSPAGGRDPVGDAGGLRSAGRLVPGNSRPAAAAASRVALVDVPVLV